MLSRCANPECGTPFRYLNQGLMFVAEWANSGDTCELTAGPVAKPWGRQEMFWLCDRCRRTLTLSMRGSEVVAVPRLKVRPAGERPLRELRIWG
jgi:hypothetical protein